MNPVNPINPINSNFQSERIRSNWINPYDSEKFGFIQIDRIDFQWASGWFGLKTNFGLDRNETVWFGYKFRNDSENFGLVRYEF